MAGTTTNFAWPFPTNGDVPNVASDIQSLAAAVDATLGSAFTAYTPVWSSTGVAPAVGNGTITGRFKRFAKWGMNSITLTLGTTSTVGTNFYRFSLPAGWTLQNTTSVYGIGSLFDSSTNTTYVGTISASSTTLVTIRTHASAAEVGATNPVTPATSDVFNLLLVTELA